MMAASLTLRLCPAFRDQFGHKITIFWDAAGHDRLGRLDRLLSCAQSQLTFADRLDQQFVARFYAGSGTAFRRDDDTTLLVYFRPNRHDTFYLMWQIEENVALA
jgi:hypothetical protein